MARGAACGLVALWLSVACASRNRPLRKSTLNTAAPTSLPSFTKLSHADSLAKSDQGGAFPGVTDAFTASGAEAAHGTVVSLRQMAALLAGRASPGPSAERGLVSFGGPADEEHPRGVLRLADASGTEYIGSIGVGTVQGPRGEPVPETVLRVIFDTGSSDLWVASDLCSHDPCTRPFRRRFNRSRSETFRAPGRAVRLETEYGSGGLQGELGADSVHIGSLVVQRQAMGLIAKEYGQAFQALPLEGIAGLGFPGLADSTTETLFDSLIKQGQLPTPEFAFYLHPNPALGGAVLWGGVDARLFEAPLVWFPVIEETYWTLDLVEFRVGNRTFEAKAHANRRPAGDSSRTSRFEPTLIVDSGTTFFMTSGDVYNAVQEAGVQPTRCSEVGSLPPLVYTLMDSDGQPREVAVPPEEYTAKAVAGGEFCVPGVAPFWGFPGEKSVMILGEVFMRRHFTVFRRSAGGRAEVGIARASHSAEALAFFQEAPAAELASTGR